jgi:hypothetical protein
LRWFIYLPAGVQSVRLTRAARASGVGVLGAGRPLHDRISLHGDAPDDEIGPPQT